MTLYVGTSGYTYKEWKDLPVIRITAPPTGAICICAESSMPDANLKEWLSVWAIKNGKRRSFSSNTKTTGRDQSWTGSF